MHSSQHSKSNAEASRIRRGVQDIGGASDAAPKQGAANELGVLQDRLGYRFADPGRLRQALTHKSAGVHNFERFEFLGDAVLGCIVARWLFNAMPQASEQQLTLMRANLVKTQALAALARDIRIGAFLTLGSSERESGGAQRSSMLADALEAVIGAVFCDGGFDAATATVERLFASRLATIGDVQLKDPKTRLQEHLQSRRLPLPCYSTITVSGADHAPTFTAGCAVQELGVRAEGKGKTRREAEQRAAAIILSRLEDS